MKLYLKDKNTVVLECENAQLLMSVQGMVDGAKIRCQPKIEFQIKSLTKIPRIIKDWYRFSTDEVIKKTVEASNSIKERKEIIRQVRAQYPDNVEFHEGYKPDCLFPPLKHQVTMFNAIARLGRSAIIADPGTCKTGAYLWGIEFKIKKGLVKKCLIITLSHLKHNVLEEMKIQVPGLTGVILADAGQAKKVLFKSYKIAKKNIDYDIYISNYESMRTLVDIIPDDYFDMIILDEAHSAGSPRSQQTKAIVNKFELTPHKHIVTGTLNANSALSFYMPFRFMGPDMVSEAKFEEFRSRHFYPVDPDQHMWKPNPGTNQHVQELIGNASVCFKKEDCLDLPPKIYKTLKCDLSPAQREEYDRTVNDFIFLLKKECEHCDKNGTSCDYVCENAILIKSALVCNTKLSQITCGFFIETAFEITNEGKRVDKSVVHWFDENPKLDMLMADLTTIPSDKKVIIWSHYTAGIKLLVDRICKAYGPESYIAVYGNVDAFEAVNKFKDDPKIRFFIANQKKAGTGLNIQFSSYQTYFSNDYSYIVRTQSEDRQHRKGQKEVVTITDLACNKTIDEKVLKVITKEKKELDKHLNSLAALGGFYERKKDN